ncbi:sensor domain-containing protein [Thetidibacter halocola]|uniref:EAL domain-containing protein n=1 Tax=Thetidibacter halocola TaxID=2827239 RepID=A0A8J7WBD9_9RHOB|nr:EAL domain-containing protein [Thetidibacter halocola]MBS0123329.1 EAL domain-containing protein [Thetidibacter halocola]
MNSRALSNIPAKVLEQLPLKCSEGLGLALADDEDGAVMVFHWCNKAFSEITRYPHDEVVGRRGTILIGQDMEQGMHLLIIDKLMNWERFSVKTTTNRKTGEPYRVQMTWNPLSDPITGNRWWLCSLIELEGQPLEAWSRYAPTHGVADQEILAKYSEELVRLEKENRRLLDLAKTVARESTEDALTGLSNRRHFEVQLKAWVAALRKGGASFAVLYVDLDRFKSVNDTLGHGAGDRLLVHAAGVLRRLSGQEDLIARMGGDEFVILKPLGDSALKISGLADEIVHEMRKPFTFEGKSILCSASVGVALADAKMASPEQVVADADEALYHAKAHGRGRWSFFTAEMHSDSIATKQLATELLVACDRNEFVPYFQPIIDAKSGHIAGAEVLVRWSHPKRGLLLPGDFLHVAQAMGIMNRIDRIVFSALREEMQHFDETGVMLPRVSINVSAGRLEDPSFIHDIKSSALDPGRLVIEILESVYLERMSETVRWALDELNELGVTIAVDDFGTGHASVQGLLKIKPSILKIDKDFIRPVLDNDDSKELLAAIMGIGKSLGMNIVAEGVETEAHAQLARELGCQYLQGYFFGKPMCAYDLHQILLKTGGQLWCINKNLGVGASAKTAL